MADPRKSRSRNDGGPRPIHLPGRRTVVRCAQCGALVQSLADQPVMEESAQCRQCGAALHSCKQCTHFDPASRFECRQPITERIARKDAANTCTYYEIRQAVERETSSGPRPVDARQAFENLFKKK